MNIPVGALVRSCASFVGNVLEVLLVDLVVVNAAVLSLDLMFAVSVRVRLRRTVVRSASAAGDECGRSCNVLVRLPLGAGEGALFGLFGRMCERKDFGEKRPFFFLDCSQAFSAPLSRSLAA